MLSSSLQLRDALANGRARSGPTTIRPPTRSDNKSRARREPRTILDAGDWFGEVALLAGRPNSHDAMARTELALEIAESLLLPEVLSHGLNTKALILATRGRHEEAELLMRHALEVALAGELSGPALRAYQNLAAIVSDRDRIREGLELAL